LLFIENASNVVIRGLAINRFVDRGILLFGATGCRIEGNFIGTDPTGTESRNLGASENSVGVETLFSSDNTIGGTSPTAPNIISGNRGVGVNLSTGSARNKVQGNLIGTAKDGTTLLRNGDGVLIGDSASANTVGGTTPASANTITFNFHAGVRVGEATNTSPNGNRILGNAIFSNGDIGIDLGSEGVTSNDPGDPDAGPNNLQNFPVLTSAKTSRRGTTIKGTLNSTPDTTLVVQLFSNPKGTDSSTLLQGKTFIGQKSVSTDGSGNATFTFKPARKVGRGASITATATNQFSGDTSEFSAGKKVVLKRR
jgi:titin